MSYIAPMAKAVKRKRPVLTVTVKPDLLDRLTAVQEALPSGTTLSGLVDELIEMSLPAMEAMVAAFSEAKTEDGTVDEARAKESLAKWVGSQLLSVRQMGGPAGEEE